MIRFVILWMIVIAFISCKSDQPSIYQEITGKTMGTTYHLIYKGEDPNNVAKEVDSLLVQINQSLSTYIDTSLISLFNQNYSIYQTNQNEVLHHYLVDNYRLSISIYEASGGAFEPTIMPIVNYWGFGYSGKNRITEVDSLEIKELSDRVGFDKVTEQEGRLAKSDTLVELDFSGIAKGYGVDQIANFLESNKIDDFYIEIGGEVFARGVNRVGNSWRTGITLPARDAGQQDFQQVIEIADKGIATSGNYRNFYESEGRIFSHTINPKTGFPERNSILSATVIAPSCAMADGYATACMVLGLEKSIEMITLQDQIEAILIYANESGKLKVYDSSKY